MQSCDQLRHFGHLHPTGNVMPCVSPGGDTDQDQPAVGDTFGEPGSEYRHGHADNAIPDGALGFFLIAQAAQRQDEKNGCRDISG